MVRLHDEQYSARDEAVKQLAISPELENTSGRYRVGSVDCSGL